MRWRGWLGAGLLAVPLIVGTATGAEPDGAEAFRFADPAITESSGLVVLPSGEVVTTNDSGDSARFFTVDPATGQTAATTTWGPSAVDVEALAPAGDRAVWVADIGDNRRIRETVQVVHVPLDGGQPTSYDLALPGGSRDAEALLAHPLTGQLFVVTKGVFGGSVLAAPHHLRVDRTNALEHVGGTGGLVTDGAFLPAGGAVVLRNYTHAWVVDTTSWQTVTTWRLPRQQQGEGLAVDATGDRPSLLISTEGVRTPVLREPLPPVALFVDLRGSPVLAALRPWPGLWWAR